jgi:WD40 repeat protein
LKHPEINKSVGNPVHCLVFVKEDRILATGATSGLVLWDVRSGERQQTLELDNRSVDSLAVDWRGQQLVAGGGTGIIKVWDARTFELRHTLGPTSGAVRGLSITHDGKTLASTSPNGQKGASDGEFAIVLWNLDSGEQLRKIRHPAPDFGVTAVSFIGGMHLITGQDREFRLIDGARGEIEQLVKLPQLPRSLGCLAVRGDDHRVATGVFEPKIRIWDLETMKEASAWDAHHELPDPRRGVTCLAWSTDFKYLVSGGMDGAVCMWDAASGRQMLKLDARGGASGGRTTGVALSADRSVLAASHIGGTATIWRISEK